ncbi:unnamed protein product [Vitrella brassicaformis CCMP3155]|uniref:Secreted protein n=1 Tax=Vitrella brassicaformis (strain CCMP3155) TaxID=1169540 RepID=A0A0G4FPN7_VITBC|nr:unnamed protein product [Vitrella brassicaformis CCMP3155]|eukprot:CEM15974.1 unnamed protein product [Vitrella brassicaformis CCMP3155]
MRGGLHPPSSRSVAFGLIVFFLLVRVSTGGSGSLVVLSRGHRNGSSLRCAPNALLPFLVNDRAVSGPIVFNWCRPTNYPSRLATFTGGGIGTYVGRIWQRQIIEMRRERTTEEEEREERRRQAEQRRRQGGSRRQLLLRMFRRGKV